MLIAARHRQLLAATAVQVLQQHAQHRKEKYAMWRDADRQRLRSVLISFHRCVATSCKRSSTHADLKHREMSVMQSCVHPSLHDYYRSI